MAGLAADLAALDADSAGSAKVSSTEALGLLAAGAHEAAGGRALDAAGRLTAGTVTVAILEMGFAPDSDTPAGFTAVSNVPFVAPTGTENLLACGARVPGTART